MFIEKCAEAVRRHSAPQIALVAAPVQARASWARVRALIHRAFHSGGPALAPPFDTHLILGPGRRTPEVGLQLRMSGWFIVPLEVSAGGPGDTKLARKDFEAALAKFGKDSRHSAEIAMMPLKFMDLIPPMSHSATIRLAAQIAQKRGGGTAFYFEDFCMHRHFGDALKLADRFGGFRAIMQRASLRMLRQQNGVPTVSSVELAEFFEGESSSMEIELLGPVRSAGKPPPRICHARFRELYRAAQEATRSEEGIAYFRKHGTMPPEAVKAVSELQNLVHGVRGPLPGPAPKPPTPEGKAPAKPVTAVDWP